MPLVVVAPAYWLLYHSGLKIEMACPMPVRFAGRCPKIWVGHSTKTKWGTVTNGPALVHYKAPGVGELWVSEPLFMLWVAQAGSHEAEMDAFYAEYSAGSLGFFHG